MLWIHKARIWVIYIHRLWWHVVELECFINWFEMCTRNFKWGHFYTIHNLTFTKPYSRNLKCKCWQLSMFPKLQDRNGHVSRGVMMWASLVHVLEEYKEWWVTRELDIEYWSFDEPYWGLEYEYANYFNT